MAFSPSAIHIDRCQSRRNGASATIDCTVSDPTIEIHLAAPNAKHHKLINLLFLFGRSLEFGVIRRRRMRKAETLSLLRNGKCSDIPRRRTMAAGEQRRWKKNVGSGRKSGSIACRKTRKANRRARESIGSQKSTD